MSRKHHNDRPLRLGGVHEVAELLGIGKAALADRRRHPSFPRLLAKLRCGPVWDLDEVEIYREARRRDPVGEQALVAAEGCLDTQVCSYGMLCGRINSPLVETPEGQAKRVKLKLNPNSPAQPPAAAALASRRITIDS